MIIKKNKKCVNDFQYKLWQIGIVTISRETETTYRPAAMEEFEICLKSSHYFVEKFFEHIEITAQRAQIWTGV